MVAAAPSVRLLRGSSAEEVVLNRNREAAGTTFAGGADGHHRLQGAAVALNNDGKG